jgi:hypothetical protein
MDDMYGLGFDQKRVAGDSQIGPAHNDTSISTAPQGAANQISDRHSSSPLGFLIHISITTPVVSALKNYCIWGFLEVQTNILYHFWIQVATVT